MAESFRREAMAGVLSASAGLAGFILVFLGFAVTALQGFSGDTSAKVLKPYRATVKWVLGSFSLGLSAVALSAAWFVFGGLDLLYWLAVISFALQFVGLGGVAYYVSRKIVFKG